MCRYDVTDHFFPILRKLKVDSIFCRVFRPNFVTVPETGIVVELISNFRNFRYYRYFNGHLCNGRPKFGHIRHQRCQINVNQRFVYRFSQILFLTVFPFLRPPFWIEDMNRKCWFAIPYKAMRWRTKLINLKKIAQKLKTWECRIVKHIKKPLWRHQINISKIWEKCHLKFLLRSFGPSFIKIGQELWKWEAVTDRQTHTHNDEYGQI